MQTEQIAPLAQTHDHHADTVRKFEHHEVQTCSCGARRYVSKGERIGTVWVEGSTSLWAHPESTFCG